MIGFSDTRGVIKPVGVPSNFHIDQAILQEKFNSFSSDSIELGFRTFEREFKKDDKLVKGTFAVIYIPPSTVIIQPKKEGKYPNPKTGRPKTTFTIGQVLTRRGTQSIPANDYEIAEIKKRIEKELHKQSMLTGRPDEFDETIYGNLIRVKELPEYVYEAKAREDDFPFSQTGVKPIRKMGRRVISFYNLQESPFQKHLESGSHKKTLLSNAFSDEDTAREVMNLLNIECIAAMRTRQLIYDYKSFRHYFPCERPPRYESWEGLTREVPRKVVWQQKSTSVDKSRFVHHSVGLRFQRIGKEVFLRLAPGYVITSNGTTPIHDHREGLLIGSLLRQRWNNQYYADLRFWLCKLPRDNQGNISFGGRIILEPFYVQGRMQIGIDGDVPSSEQEVGPNRTLSIKNPSILRSSFLNEPKLVFGSKREDEDPRIGMKYFGPFHAEDEEPLKQMRVGIIGTGITRTIAKDVLNMLRNEQKALHFGKTNRFLFADFPGFNSTTNVSCDIVDSDSWGATITKREIEDVIGVKDTNERIGAAAKLLRDKVKSIAMEDTRPDLVLCLLPTEINDECGIGEKTRGAKKRKVTKGEIERLKLEEDGQTFLSDFDIGFDETGEDLKSYDLRDALKGMILEYGIPIQVLLQHKAEALLNYKPATSTIQDPATFCWNLASAMYYKANGKPWRLAKLEEGTCYVGIAFYKSRIDVLNRLHVSMAQVFTHSGDGFVLRGADVLVEETTKQPYLPKDKANELLQDAIEMYTLKAGTKPSRVVIHKTSLFTEGERQGFLDAIADAKADLVNIRRSRDYRFVRTGNYPVLRGTFLKLTDSEYLLYTNGYIPRLRTYPGQRIPVPLSLKMDCDSEPEKVAKEILKLSKINWNTTKFSDREPITIVFPQSVGKVLAELPEDSTIQSHYRFYM